MRRAVSLASVMSVGGPVTPEHFAKGKTSMVMTTRGAVVNPLLRKEDNAVTVAAKNLAYSIGVSQWGALLPLFQRIEDL